MGLFLDAQFCFINLYVQNGFLKAEIRIYCSLSKMAQSPAEVTLSSKGSYWEAPDSQNALGKYSESPRTWMRKTTSSLLLTSNSNLACPLITNVGNKLE